MAKEWKLQVMEVPRKAPSGVYDLVLADFVKSVLENPAQPVKSARVAIPNKREKTMQIGLAKAVQVSGRKDVTVRMVEGEVFLAKK